MTFSGKPVIDHTERELKAFIRSEAHVRPFGTLEAMAELDRRAARRQANASFFLSAVGLLIAVLAIVVSGLKP